VSVSQECRTYLKFGTKVLGGRSAGVSACPELFSTLPEVINSGTGTSAQLQDCAAPSLRASPMLAASTAPCSVPGQNVAGSAGSGSAGKLIPTTVARASRPAIGVVLLNLAESAELSALTKAPTRRPGRLLRTSCRPDSDKYIVFSDLASAIAMPSDAKAGRSPSSRWHLQGCEAGIPDLLVGLSNSRRAAASWGFVKSCGPRRCCLLQGAALQGLFGGSQAPLRIG
jgi:hypothetical protein